MTTGRPTSSELTLSIFRPCVRIALFLLLIIRLPALGETPREANGRSGRWRGPVGDLEMRSYGGRLEGRLLSDSRQCPFAAGEMVLRGSVLDDVFAGEVRLCLTECDEEPAEVWGFALLVLEEGRMAGAVSVESTCSVPGRGPNGGLVFHRLLHGHVIPREALPTGLPISEAEYDPRRAAEPREKALTEARAGAVLLQRGRFEAARKRFEQAVLLDPTYAEGYNGIGVTLAARRDHDEAIVWYQRSILVSPDIPDAYYNLACAYAQTERPDLAVGYLRLAVLNGYSQLEHLIRDPELEPLQAREDYRALIGLARSLEGSREEAAAGSVGAPLPTYDSLLEPAKDNERSRP